MTFREFAEYLQKLEATSKRLEITAILSDLIKNLGDKEIAEAIYLSLGYLKAPYENPKFNVADKTMFKMLENAYGVKSLEIQNLYSKSGDLGDVAYEILKDTKAKSKTTPSILAVYKKLAELAEVAGTGSQDLKIKKMTEILQSLDRISAKFITRIVLGTTRLGFTELTVLDALSGVIEGDKSLREKIEDRYSVYPDIGYIVKKVKMEGTAALKEINMKIGVPILAQKCQRLASPEEIVEKMQKVWAEFKYDGTRVQLHMDRTKKPVTRDAKQTALFGESKTTVYVKTFTRNQEETTDQYPDLVAAAKKQIDADSVIIDGEAVGYNKETGQFLPFQEIMQRKRKYDVAQAAKDIPLKYFVFDILYLNGKTLVDKLLTERRELLQKIIKKGPVLEINTHLETNNGERLAEFFDEAKEKNLEGIIAKNPNSAYQAGARSFSWVKLKKADTKLLDDTVDCVVLGYYFGKGVRAEFGIGGFLVGVYDKDSGTFKTITKIGTGLKEDDWHYLKKEADKIKVPKLPANVDIAKMFVPDVILTPKIVVEVGADEISKSPSHTAGFALRFPRLIKFRADRKAADATSIEEIRSLYKLQKRGYY